MFASPLAFLWLLAVVPVLVALYFVRQETRIIEVPSIFHMLPLPEAQIPARQRLRQFVHSRFFWIQLCLLLLGAAALSQPVRERETRHTVFIIDVTASMKAIEGQTGQPPATRLFRAVDTAIERMTDTPPEERIALLTAGSSIKSWPFSANRQELKGLLEDIKATDTAGDMADAVYAASNLLLSVGGGKVVLFTDSQVSLPPSILDEGLNIEIVNVGSVVPNVAIASVDAPTGLLEPGGKVLTRLRNFSPEPASTTVRVRLNEEAVATRQISLEAMGSHVLTFDIKDASGLIQVELDDDALRADNVGFTMLPPREPLRILIRSTHGQIATLLAKLESFEVLHLKPGENVPEAFEPDITVAEGVARNQSVMTNTLFVTPEEDCELFAVNGQSEGEVYYWSEGHPLIRQVALDNLGPQKFPQLEFDPEVEKVFGSERWPMAGTYSNGNRRVAICALPLREMLNDPTAVILLMRLLEWCNPRTRAASATYDAGSPIVAKVPDDLQSLTVTSPNGSQRPINVKSGEAIIADTDQAGVYRLASDGFERAFIVRVNTSESDLTQPALSLKLGDENSLRGFAKSSYTPWLLLSIPWLMAGEWWLYFRRRR